MTPHKFTDAEIHQIEAELRKEDRDRMRLIPWVLGAWTVLAVVVGLWVVL